MIYLSAHFTLDEMTISEWATRHGISNVPTSDEVIANLHTLAEGLERVRRVLDNHPIQIRSAYRAPKVNAGVGGARNSQHMDGLAADIICPTFGTPELIAETIADHEDMVGFDQLISEGAWCHVSFSDNPRGEILTAHFGPGGVAYSRGLA